GPSRHAEKHAEELRNDIYVVYPQPVYNLWIKPVENVDSLKNTSKSRCQVRKNRGINFLIHRLWVIQPLVRLGFVDSVHKYSTLDPQLVHNLCILIHKLSTI